MGYQNYLKFSDFSGDMLFITVACSPGTTWVSTLPAESPKALTPKVLIKLVYNNYT